MEKSGLIIGAVAGGMIATGALVSVIPVIGTGAGAAAITSGLALLAGGPIAAGGGGMLGGLAVFGAITTTGTSVGALIGEHVGESMNIDTCINKLKKCYPNITNNNNIEKLDVLIKKYNNFIPEELTLVGEIPILVHINDGMPFIGSSIILTPNEIMEIKGQKIITCCKIADINIMKRTLSRFLEWEQLNITTHNNTDLTFYIRHKNVLERIDEIIKLLRLKRL